MQTIRKSIDTADVKDWQTLTVWQLLTQDVFSPELDALNADIGIIHQHLNVLNVVDISKITKRKSALINLDTQHLNRISQRGQLKIYLTPYKIEPDLGRPKYYLHLFIEGSIESLCQRCHEPMQEAINIVTLIECFLNEKAYLALNIEDEQVDSIFVDEVLLAQDVIQDELLLCMQPFPKHEDCSNIFLSKPQHHLQAFSVLADLKSQLILDAQEQHNKPKKTN